MPSSFVYISLIINVNNYDATDMVLNYLKLYVYGKARWEEAVHIVWACHRLGYSYYCNVFM